MRSATALGLVAAAALAACQPQPPPEFEVPSSRTYQASKAEVWEGVLGYLDANEIAVRRQDFARGEIVAGRQGYEDQGWAWCERAIVADRSSDSRRPTRARPSSRDLALQIQVRALDGASEVLLAAEFSEEQINPYRNLPLTQPCLSTGVLERELLAAVES